MKKHMLSISGLKHFQLAKFRLAFLAEERIDWQPDAGSVIGKALDEAFERLFCVRRGDECIECFVGEDCPRWNCFVRRSVDPNNNFSTTRPYIIHPPVFQGQGLEPGQQFQFDLTLIRTELIKLYPKLWMIVREMGNSGFGSTRSKAIPLSIHSLGYNGSEEISQELYLVESGPYLLNPPIVLSVDDIARDHLEETGLFSITFVSPLRIRHDKHFLQGNIPYHVLLSHLLERIRQLDRDYYGGRWKFTEDDERSWVLNASKEVRLVSEKTHWGTSESSEMSQRVAMGFCGLEGEFVYMGDFTSYVSVLRIGEWLHIGKHAAWGYGRFRFKSLHA